MTNKAFTFCFTFVALFASVTIAGATAVQHNDGASYCNQVVNTDWSGNYQAEYCAGETVGGTSICFILEFTLNKTDDGNYVGDLGVDGYQTYDRCSIYAKEEAGGLNVYYKEGIDGHGFYDGQEGQLLVTLKKGRKGRTVALWSEYLIEKDLVAAKTTVKTIKERNVVD